MASPYRFDDPAEEESLFLTLERRREALRRYSEQATPDVADRIADISRTAPNLKPGVAVALAKAGHDGSSRVTRRASMVSPLKFATRVAFTSLDALQEEVIKRPLRALTAASARAAEEGRPLVGIPGELGETFRESGRSAGSIALARIGRGERVDLGTGFLPGGEAFAQARQEQERLRFVGDPISTGRTLAFAFALEPGTRAHKLVSGLSDATVTFGADPAAVAGGSAAKIRGAKQAFMKADIAPSIRKLGTSMGLIDNAPRKTVLPELVDQWLKSNPGRKVIGSLARTDSVDAIWKGMGKKVDLKTAVELADAKTPGAVEGVLKSKLGIQIREAPKWKPIEGIRRTKESVRLIQQMPGNHILLDDIDDAVEQLDRLQKAAKLPLDAISKNNERLARARGTVEAADVVFDVGKDIATRLVGKGVPKGRARELTAFFPDNTRDLVKFFVDEIGENVPVAGAIIDGTGKALPSPHLFMEYTRSIPMPDVREIRRLTSKYPNLWTNPAVKMAGSLAAGLTEAIWKPLVLLRGAWTVRVVGEEQARMGVSGFDSAFNHPLSWISYVTGRKGTTDILGEAFDVTDDASEYVRALSRRGKELDPTGYQRVKNKILYRRGEENFVRAWGEEIDQLAADPVARQVSKLSIDDAKEWFWNGPGQKFRKQMAEADRRDPLLTRAGADFYIDSVLNRINIKVGGDTGLMEAIAKGAKLGKEDVAKLARMADEGTGPQMVKGDQFVRVGERTVLHQKLDRATESMFNALMTVPTNKLSRSVTFKQAYFKRVDELKDLGLADEEIDVVAKAFALDTTKKLLYDLTEKSQFFDITRALFPFGEAWKEVLTRWAKIGVQQPQIPRRFQQAIEGGREAGFFYNDDATGEEMFAYPFGQQLTEALLGVPVRLEGRLSGLSIGSSAMPGFGPVVQLSVGKLIPDKPEWDQVREFILPFGEPDVKGGILESQFPAWLKRFVTAMRSDEFSDRMYANTVGDMANHLVATGRYSVGSQEEQERLLSAAKSRATGLYLIRSMAQFVAPTGPQPKFMAQDKRGEWYTAQALSQEFRKYQEQDYRTAGPRFLSRFGDDAFLYLQPKSRSLIPGIPVTEDGVMWVRKNPEVEKLFPKTYGLFAPDGGKFDFEAYNQQLERGQRERILPKERFALANHRVASIFYERAKDTVGDSPADEQREWLRKVKGALMEEYPGYNENMTFRNTDATIMELEKAIQHPTIAKTDAAKGVALYLQARDKALAEAKNRELAHFKIAKSARDLREWLRQVSEAIGREHPGFEKAWDMVFERELGRDEDAEEEAA